MQLKCNDKIFNILENTKIIEQVETLNLSEFRLTRDLHPPKDANKFKRLRKLDIQKNDLQVEGLKRLVSAKFPKLEKLNIGNIGLIPQITIPILTEKIKILENMKYIHLTLTESDGSFGVRQYGPALNNEVLLKRFHEKSLGYPKLRIDLDDQVSNYRVSSGFFYFK